jgi:hypothetical protein
VFYSVTLFSTGSGFVARIVVECKCTEVLQISLAVPEAKNELDPYRDTELEPLGFKRYVPVYRIVIRFWPRALCFIPYEYI